MTGYRPSRLDREVQRAIDEENARFLADPRAVADARADLYRRRLEGDPTAQPIPVPAFQACDSCPFESADPDAIEGHQRHAPERGWLGEGERHTMAARPAAKVPCAAHRSTQGGTLSEYQSWCASCRAASAGRP